MYRNFQCVSVYFVTNVPHTCVTLAISTTTITIAVAAVAIVVFYLKMRPVNPMPKETVTCVQQILVYNAHMYTFQMSKPITIFFLFSLQ